MTKTTREIEKQKNESSMWAAVIVSIILSVLIFSIIMILYVENELKDVPVQVCHNETYIEKQPMIQQVTCPCATQDSDFYREYHSYCLMWCGNITGYKDVEKVKQVCEFKLKDLVEKSKGTG